MCLLGRLSLIVPPSSSSRFRGLKKNKITIPQETGNVSWAVSPSLFLHRRLRGLVLL